MQRPKFIWQSKSEDFDCQIVGFYWEGYGNLSFLPQKEGFPHLHSHYNYMF